jgi:hypothetical protein
MKSVIVLALIGLAFGLVLKFNSGGTPVGWCMLVMLVGAPVLGTIATIDDDLPGGWSNPDGKSLPPWLHWHTPVQLALMGSISGIGFAIDTSPASFDFLLWLLLGTAGLVGTFAFLRHHQRDSAA